MGDAVVVAQNVSTLALGANSAFSAAAAAVLSSRTGPLQGIASQLAWFDRTGKMLATVGGSADQTDIQLSPDGGRAASAFRFDPQKPRYLGLRPRPWTADTAYIRCRRRVSSVWAPDGRRIAFSAARPSPMNLFVKNADGSGTEDKLPADGPGNKYLKSWSSDGRLMLYTRAGVPGSQTRNDLWVLPLAEDRKPRPFLETPFSEGEGALSPMASGSLIAWTNPVVTRFM